MRTLSGSIGAKTVYSRVSVLYSFSSGMPPIPLSHKHNQKKYRDRRTGAFRILTIWETKTAVPALALANNLSADNADNRFHAAFYGVGMTFGQEGRGTIPAARLVRHFRGTNHF